MDWVVVVGWMVPLVWHGISSSLQKEGMHISMIRVYFQVGCCRLLLLLPLIFFGMKIEWFVCFAGLHFMENCTENGLEWVQGICTVYSTRNRAD